MWIKRDFSNFLLSLVKKEGFLPIKILKGPRQVGKTSILDHQNTHKLILFDDLAIRQLANENPALFLDQFSGPLILDEATLAPAIFPEIKKRVDEQRRLFLKKGTKVSIDIWITGSNQTLLRQAIRESLAGRANYFSLNTLSIHEIKQLYSDFSLSSYLQKILLCGGWPELYINPKIDPINYLND